MSCVSVPILWMRKVKFRKASKLPNFKQLVISGIVTLKICQESAVQKELLKWHSYYISLRDRVPEEAGCVCKTAKQSWT